MCCVLPRQTCHRFFSSRSDTLFKVWVSSRNVVFGLTTLSKYGSYTNDLRKRKYIDIIRENGKALQAYLKFSLGSKMATAVLKKTSHAEIKTWDWVHLALFSGRKLQSNFLRYILSLFSSSCFLFHRFIRYIYKYRDI